MPIRWLILCAVVTAGCSGSTAPPPETLVDVTGTVRVAGQPTSGVRLLFTPSGTTTGQGGFALTDGEGAYSVIHTRTNKPGLPEGEYVVTFSRFLKPDGSPMPANQSPYSGGARESVPAKWSDVAKKGSHNTVKVTGGGKPLDFAIPKS